VKKLIALSVAAVFALGAAGLAVAQDKKADDKKMEKSDMKAEKKADKKPTTKTANGTVKSAAADSVVVAGKDKGKDAEWTFAVDPKTSIKKGGKAITAADIKAGDSVTVKYTEHDGKAMAQLVTVKAPAAASAKKMDDKKMEKMETKPADKK
jgi:ribosomal protein S1